ETAADRLTLVAAGITLHEALAAHDELAGAGIAVRGIHCYSGKAVDAGALVAAARATGRQGLPRRDHHAAGGRAAARPGAGGGCRRRRAAPGGARDPQKRSAEEAARALRDRARRNRDEGAGAARRVVTSVATGPGRRVEKRQVAQREKSER